MNRIAHIIEPARLLLAWQSQGSGLSRKRHIVAELVREEGGGVVFRYLLESEGFRTSREKGFSGYPAFEMGVAEHRSGVLDAFMRRVPPNTRKDFKDFLEQLRLPRNSKISDLALLGYSGAALPSDGFSLIHPFDQVDGPCELMLEVAGFRYQPVDISDIHVGDEAEFEAEPGNEYDPEAVRILVNGQQIGYVNRGQTGAFHYWFERGSRIKATVERTNGRPDRPLVYLFVEVRPPGASEQAA